MNRSDKPKIKGPKQQLGERSILAGREEKEGRRLSPALINEIKVAANGFKNLPQKLVAGGKGGAAGKGGWVK